MSNDIVSTVAKQLGLSLQATADLRSFYTGLMQGSVEDIVAKHQEVVRAPLQPGHQRSPSDAARNMIATAALAQKRAEFLGPGERETVLVDAGLQAPPRGDAAPTPRQKDVSHWHLAVRAAEAKRAELTARIANRTLPNEVRAAAREELARTPIPPPPPPPPVVHD
ncbi:MAG: hypothetical protein RJA59_1784 [Pseudomonadota bacterium]